MENRAVRGAGNGWILLVRPAWINRLDTATLFSRVEQSSAHLHVAGEATYIDDIPELAGHAVKDACIVTNPRYATVADVQAIYGEAI